LSRALLARGLLVKAEGDNLLIWERMTNESLTICLPDIPQRQLGKKCNLRRAAEHGLHTAAAGAASGRLWIELRTGERTIGSGAADAGSNP